MDGLLDTHIGCYCIDAMMSHFTLKPLLEWTMIDTYHSTNLYFVVYLVPSFSMANIQGHGSLVSFILTLEDVGHVDAYVHLLGLTQ